MFDASPGTARRLIELGRKDAEKAIMEGEGYGGRQLVSREDH